jgi:hypothetical protein
VSQITAASAVLYNASLSLASGGGDSSDGLLMEIGSAAAQALANGAHAFLPAFNYSLSFRCFLLLQARQLPQCTALPHIYFAL